MYDYKTGSLHHPDRDRPRRLRRLLLFATCATLALAFAGLTIFGKPGSPTQGVETLALTLPLDGTKRAEERRTPPANHTRIPFEPQTIRSQIDTPATPAAPAIAPQAITPAPWQQITVNPGDNLSLIFARHGLSKKDLHTILESDPEAKKLTRIKPGQILKVVADDDGHVTNLIVELDYRRSLHIDRESDAYVARIVDVEPEIRRASVLARIQQSLFLDGQAAGLS